MDYRLRTDTVGITVHEDAGWASLIKQVKDAMSNGGSLTIGAASQLGVASGPVTISGLQIKDAVIDGVPIMDSEITAELRVSNNHRYLLEFETAAMFAAAKLGVEGLPPGAAGTVREKQFFLSATRNGALLLTGGLSATLTKV